MMKTAEERMLARGDRLYTQITHFSWREFKGKKSDVPYIVMNATWKVDKEKDSSLWQQYFDAAQEYSKVLAIDDKDKYEKHIFSEWMTPYLGHYWATTMQNEKWQYLEKFDTFWKREWLADCQVVRAALYELQHIATMGEPIDTYRCTTDHLIFLHLDTLDSYWD